MRTRNKDKQNKSEEGKTASQEVSSVEKSSLEEFYTLKEVATMLNVHIETTRRMVVDGHMPGAFQIRPDERSDWRIPKIAFDEYVRSGQEQAQKKVQQLRIRTKKSDSSDSSEMNDVSVNIQFDNERNSKKE